MISVVVYGRNDTHGYNAHRRVALSLNCIAEVLDDVADEIVFVDYNTPDELPTVPEALADTLTERCRSRLRVLRVPANVHERRFSDATSLPIVEPVARNVAARRADPTNRWLLMTNTDMVFLPLVATSLTDVCAQLEDGFYTAPRFELPEWLWEQLPRDDPEHAMRELRALAPALRLDEVTTSHDWLRFDSAGDFQLVLLNDFVAIDGLDERMTLGWHVDANLGQRMLLRHGSIESLQGEVAGYHCNHLRTATTYQASDVANDLHRFVLALDEAELPEQRTSWGLAEEEVEEIDLAPAVGRSFTAAVAAAVGVAPSRPRPTDARDEKWRLEYDSGHVFAFVVDAIRVAPRRSAIAYVGVNATLETMLHALIGDLGDRPPLRVVVPGGAPDDLAAADVTIVDLGIDSGLFAGPLAEASGARARALRAGLIGAFDALRALVDGERERVREDTHPRQLVLVNSAAIYWNAFCRAHLHLGSTTPHSNVRRAVVKLVPDDDAAADAAATRARQLRRWITRLDAESRGMSLRPGRNVPVNSLETYAGFGRGWGFPDRARIATRGSRAELSLSAIDPRRPSRLVLTFDPIDTEAGSSARRFLERHIQISHTGDELVWEIALPPPPESGVVDIALELGDDPPALHLRELALHSGGRLRQAVRSTSQSSRGRITPRN